MFILIAGIVIFLGIHSVRIVAPEWRAARISAMGENGWKGAYSLLSLAGLVLIVWGYARYWPDAPTLYVAPAWMYHVTALLMLVALIGIGIFNLPPGKLKPFLKNPMLLSVKTWAIAHLLVNGDLASILLFGSFLAWAIIDLISVKRRGEAPAEAGPVKWDIAAIIFGVVLYGLFVWKLHWWLFGAQPFAIG